ncbi:WD repeat-containing and planar cell polarity effector protein fritz homolog [Saccostrea echinata]|uniref:WD repeat-containing and planar cell polarity effector protein fritz homolog n=1 Tax=Saccostrea echinata TaxID=191078 RepID=UPI002A7F4138|nr:WD repeat-containing and planar cell polarity effector protein fritz homolog [Saccostrea echinata]
MVTCMTEFFIWSLKDSVYIPDEVIGCHTYHDKTHSASVDQLYHEEKQHFDEERDVLWAPRNKRPEKLRDILKEVEDLLQVHRIVQIRWRSRQVLQLVLSNMVMVSFVLSGNSGTTEKVFLDKSMLGKFSADLVSDAYLSDQFLLTSYPDRPKLDYGYFVKRPPLGEGLKRLEKLSVWEPKITQIDIPGPVGRRIERLLSANTRLDMLLVWWPTSSEEAWPWSPMSSEKDRANMIVLSIHGPNIDVLTFARTECDPIYAGFSRLQPHRVFTVEQAMSGGGDTTAQCCTYEIVQGKIQRISVTSIPLKSHVICQCRNPSEDKLILGCADGSLVLYDEIRKATLMIRASVIPVSVAWHPQGTLFFVASARGDVQVFDLALTPLRIQLVSEDQVTQRVLQLHKFFKFPVSLKEIKWCHHDPDSVEWNGDYTDALFMHFEKGPPCLLQLHLGVVSRERFSGLELIKEYLKNWQVDEAVTLLTSMNWDTDSTTAYSSLSAIVNLLLRLPLNAERESQLETTLGAFYAPKFPLSEVVILDFRDPISRLARRFFHHLLRYSRFDKAFLLAVDIDARDLFMDIHYMALDKGETALAEVAKRKAEQVETESIDSFDGFDDGLLQNGYHNPNIQNQSDFNVNELPASRQHPWQQGEHQASLDNRHLHNGVNGDLSDRPSYLGDLELEADLIHDYTAALQLDDPEWFSNTHIEDTDWQDQDPVDNGNRESQDDEEEDASVKVIHFGVV